MERQRKLRGCIGLLLAALLISGCRTQTPESTSGSSAPQNQTESSAWSDLTDPTQTTTGPISDPTEPTDATVQDTQPEQTTEPGGQDTQPSVPAPAFNAAQVIEETVNDIVKLMPQLKYKAGYSDGAAAQILAEATLSQKDVAAELHDGLLELFEYDLYLEQQIDPSQIQPVIFDYTYSISYCGVSTEGRHIFEIRYVVNKQSYVSDNFDSDGIIAQVHQRILDSALVNVTAFVDDAFTTAVLIDDVPFFYDTQASVDRLTGMVEGIIYGENLGAVRYTQFRLVFHSKGETSYVFLLYLR